MIKNHIKKILYVSMFFFSINLGTSLAEPGSGAVAFATGSDPNCDAEAYYSSLAGSESGGCGNPTQYHCMGPVITSGSHAGDRPLGMYQFMPNTLRGMGIPTAGFVGNAQLQEAAIRQFTADNDACLQRNGAYDHIGTVRNGVTITRSGLLGAAHLGGCGGASSWARGSSNPSDQLGTSLADYAARFGGYGMFGDVPGGTCGGGVANAADLFAQAQVEGRHDLIGCDEDVGEQTTDRVDALMEQQFEAANSVITQPTPVEQLTCFDQTTEIFSEIGGIHSDPEQGNIDDSIVPNVQQPLMQQMQQFLTGNIAGGINDVINNAFSNLTGGLGGGAGGAGNCDMMDQAWLIGQCIEMPSIPSLGDIIGGQMGDIMGQVGSIAGSLGNPERMLEQVCSMANDALQGSFGDLNSVFESAAESALAPITDRVGQ